jgi:hypothetical protein
MDSKLLFKSFFSTIYAEEQKGLINNNGLLIHYLDNEQTAEICLGAVKGTYKAFEYYIFEDKEIREAALKQNVHNVKHLSDRTPVVNTDINKVKVNGMYLQHIENQTEELCEEAIKQNPSSFIYVKNQTPNLCFLAVKKNGMLLEHVIDQDETLCKYAMMQNSKAFRFVKNKTPDLCKLVAELEYPIPGIYNAFNYAVTKDSVENTKAISVTGLDDIDKLNKISEGVFAMIKTRQNTIA